MTDFDDPAFFGDRWAGRYADLSGGRVALPPARRGFAVEGIEASAAVVDRLRATPGGAEIPVRTADLADVPGPGPFPLLSIVWNSLFNLTSQQRQMDTFRNVARVLAPGGVFVCECYVPDLQLLPVAHRYCWPAELDLMAQLAGLHLRERWADWDRRPFGPASESHISVYALP